MTLNEAVKINICRNVGKLINTDLLQPKNNLREVLNDTAVNIWKGRIFTEVTEKSKTPRWWIFSICS